MSNRDKYIHLIYLQLQGSLTSSEEQELESWLAQAPENEKIKSQITQSLELMEDYSPDFPVDVEADYAKVRSQMGLTGKKKKAATSTSAKVSTLRPRRNWLAIAASVALLITAGLFFWNQQSKGLDWVAFQTGANEVKNVQLADGTTVWLNENSRLDYPKTFTGEDRPVKLEGEAFFDVAKNPEKAFKISTAESNVKVLGTSFNVRAYTSEPNTIIEVKTGRVQFTSTNNSQNVVLTQNQGAALDHSSKNLSAYNSENLNVSSWQSNKLAFKNTGLAEVFKDLEKHFNIEIAIEPGTRLKKCRFSQTPKEVKLEDLFSKLKRLYKIEISSTGSNKYLVKGGNC